MTTARDYSERQIAQYNCLLDVAENEGKWNKGPMNEGAHYFGAEDNPFIDEGMVCENCVFFRAPDGCYIVTGKIDPEGLCKLWVIPERLLEV